MFCKKCGYKLSEDASVCPFCGFKTSDELIKKTSTPKPTIVQRQPELVQQETRNIVALRERVSSIREKWETSNGVSGIINRLSLKAV
jgi:uncharacterized membrane protein YvbJ